MRRLVGVIALGSALAVAPGATAKSVHEVVIRVYNDTKYAVRITPVSGSHCWENRELDNDRISTVAPHTSSYIVTATVRGLGTPAECPTLPDETWRHLAIEFQDSAGNWYDPVERAAVAPTSHHYELHGDFVSPPIGQARFVMRGIFDRWVPINPTGEGKSVNPTGAFCIPNNFEASGNEPTRPQLTFHIIDDPNKCIAQPEEVRIGDGTAQSESAGATGISDVLSGHGFAVPASPRLPTGVSRSNIRLQGSGSENGPIIVDFVQTIESMCRWVRAYGKWSRSNECGEISTPSAWTIPDPKENVSDLEPEDNTVQPITSLQLLARLTDRVAAPENGKLRFVEKVRHGTSTSVETTDGWENELGLKIKAGGGVKEVFFVGAEVEGKHTWNHEVTTGTKTSTEREEVKEKEQETKAGMVTYLYVFQKQAKLEFNFTANIIDGTRGEAHPVKSPVERLIGMSSAATQPCLGLMVGPGDFNSIIAHGKRLFDQGYTWTNPNLSAGQRNLLRALPGFRHSKGRDTCPGWPDGYTGAVVFRGRAHVDIRATAPAEDTGGWTGGGMRELVYCSFALPLNSKEPSEEQEKTFCFYNGNKVSGQTSGVQGDGVLRGNGQSDLLLAHGGGEVDQMQGGTGKYNVMDGASGTQVMVGGPQTNVEIGRQGSDTLIGTGTWNTLAGGSGDDFLVAKHGMNSAAGGAGNDHLFARYDARGGLLGGSGNDRLTIIGANTHIAAIGGAGNDVYTVLAGAPAADAIESVHGGLDTMRAAHRFRLPPHVEIGRAWHTKGGIAISAGEGSQKLVGGPGGDTLAGGEGDDILSGGAGNDTLLIGDWGADSASGGPGADTFVPVAQPVGPPAVPTDMEPITPTANLITDFRPGQGDRLVLKASSFGGQVTRLGEHMVVHTAADAQPIGAGPQLLFSTNGSLLRYDSDGTGPAISYVVAILKGFKQLPVSAIRVQASH